MKKQRQTSGVFEQLGFDENEAANIRLRASMMDALIDEIERKKFTQAQTAKALGVSQPRVSDLLHGKLHLFSMDMLVMLLSKVGMRVEMKVRRAA